MHGQYAFERQAVVHDREDGLLDLARVLGTADQDLAARAALLALCAERGCVEEERLRLEVGQLRLTRLDEERLGKKGMPRRVADDPHADAMRGVGPGEGVDDVDVALVQMREDLRAQPLEALLLDRRVDVAPPDPVLGAGFADRKSTRL